MKWGQKAGAPICGNTSSSLGVIFPPSKWVSECVSKYKTKGDGKSSQSAKIVGRVFVIMTVDLAKDYDQNVF